MGTGLYGFVASPSIQAMINAFGWRWAYVGFVYMSSGKDAVSTLPGLTVREVYANYRFWAPLIGFVFLSVPAIG